MDEKDVRGDVSAGTGRSRAGAAAVHDPSDPPGGPPPSVPAGVSDADGIRLGACLVDSELRFLATDDEFAEVLGRPVEEHIGRQIGDLSPGLEALFGDSVRQVLATGEPIFGDSIREVHAAGEPIFPSDASGIRDGVLRTTRAWFMPRRDAAGRVDAVSIVVADLASLRRADVLLRTFADLSARLAAEEPVEEICRSLLARIASSVGATWGAAVARDPSAGPERFVSTVGPGVDDVAERLRVAGDATFPVLTALKRGRPIFMPRGADAVRTYPDLAALPITVGSLCAVPGFSGGSAMAAIALVWEREHVFEDREKHAITAFADLLAQALAVAQIRVASDAARRRAEERADHVARLRDLAAALAGAATVEEVADLILAAICDVYDADGTALFVRDTTRDQVRLVRASGSIEARARDVDGSPIDAGFATSAVLRAGRPAIFGSHAELSTLSDLGAAGAPLRGLMAAGASIPLRGGGEVLGTFALAFDQERTFADDERLFLVQVGDVGGQALLRVTTARREREMAALVDLAHDAMYVRDTAGTILAWNRGAEETYGWTRDEAVGRSATSLLASEFPAGEAGALAALATVGAWEGEIVQRRRDGRVLVMETRWSTIRLQDGTDAILEVGRDITARRRAEDEARLNTQRTMSALGVLPVSLFMFDRDLQPTWAHQRGRAVASAPGGPGSASVPATLADLLPSEAGAEATRAARVVLATGATVRLDVEVPGPDGPLAIEYTVGPIRAADGAVDGVIAAGIDVTGRRREEQERRRMEAEVLEARRLDSLGMIAGGIAHDFNNILAGIVGNAELALLDLPADARSVADAIDDIRASAMRASDLTRQLLAYAGQERMYGGSVDITTLVEQMRGELRASVPRRVDLRLDLARELPRVEGDAVQLRHVVADLVANAADAIGDGDGTIAVRTAADEAAASVILSVQDDGEGMDDAVRERMFEPFFSTRFTGRGLGLAAALGIVQGHHGTIEVDTARGVGTTVRVILPAMPVPARAAALPDDRPVSVHGRILVVDDEVEMRRVAARALERAGHVVEDVVSGEEAIERLRSGGPQPDVMVLDLTMPGIDGATALDAARRLAPGLPAVVMSGYAPDAVAGRFAGVERVRFLHKPFAIGDLTGAVRSALEGDAAGGVAAGPSAAGRPADGDGADEETSAAPRG